VIFKLIVIILYFYTLCEDVFVFLHSISICYGFAPLILTFFSYAASPVFNNANGKGIIPTDPVRFYL
jgi:hypothetical protein